MLPRLFLLMAWVPRVAVADRMGLQVLSLLPCRSGEENASPRVSHRASWHCSSFSLPSLPPLFPLLPLFPPPPLFPLLQPLLPHARLLVRSKAQLQTIRLHPWCRMWYTFGLGASAAPYTVMRQVTPERLVHLPPAAMLLGIWGRQRPLRRPLLAVTMLQGWQRPRLRRLLLLVVLLECGGQCRML